MEAKTVDIGERDDRLSPPTKLKHQQQQLQQQQRSSPLALLKKRVRSGGKKRRDSGQHSDGDYEPVGTIDEERSDVGASPVTESPLPASRRLSLDSASSSSQSSSGQQQQQQQQQQQILPNKEKPRRGIAKVFHDLKHRSRVRKSHSAPPTAMDNNQVILTSPPSLSLATDDDSFSSYATPMEAHSSGYSTPLFESNVASPETSMSESFVEEDEEQLDNDDDEAESTAIESFQSPVQVSFNPFSASPLPANISRLVCGVYIVGPTLRRLDLSDPSIALPHLLATAQVAAAANDHSATTPPAPSTPLTGSSETLSVSSSSNRNAPNSLLLETDPVDVETVENTVAAEASNNATKPDFGATDMQHDNKEATPISSAATSNVSPSTSSTIPSYSSPTEAATNYRHSPSAGHKSKIPLLAQHRASIAGSSVSPSDKLKLGGTATSNEVRFCFSEYVHGESSPSPNKGFIRSLPSSDQKMESTSSNNHHNHHASAGVDTNGYPKNEHLYKVLVIGELGTGKTSIIKRYVHQFFSQHYRATIGVDFALKVVHWDQSTVIRLQLWDIAGQERFGNMTRVYYKEAVGAFIVFDVTRSSTFESVAKWKQDLDTKVQLPDGSPIPCVLLANKCDQPKEGIAASPVKLDEYCKDKGFAGWFETSAKDNINIDDAAKFLVGTILQNDQWSTSVKEEDADKLELNGRGGNAMADKNRGGCC